MKFEIPKCPKCGQHPRGIIEDIVGCLALVTGDDDATVFVYEGETKVNWEGQTTCFDKAGRATLQCGKGHEWQSLVTEFAR